jgi:hypothetical protein
LRHQHRDWHLRGITTTESGERDEAGEDARGNELHASHPLCVSCVAGHVLCKSEKLMYGMRM